MDEPFGALDPITRHRLQTELRRLHRDVGKTIIFVTHDIDEAIQMGDRIAILREGGVLAQYDTPDAILAHPADDFVAKFIGEDRALRRLALRTVARGANCRYQAPRSRSPGTWVTPDTTVRNAVSLMLELKTERARRQRRRPRARHLPPAPTQSRSSDGRRQRPGHPELRPGRLAASPATTRSAGAGCTSTGATRSARRSGSTSS